jgi:hypothetical protein
MLAFIPWMICLHRTFTTWLWKEFVLQVYLYFWRFYWHPNAGCLTNKDLALVAVVPSNPSISKEVLIQTRIHHF